MNKTARFVLKMVAAGLAFSDIFEAVERRKACRLSKSESSDYADEELYQ